MDKNESMKKFWDEQLEKDDEVAILEPDLSENSGQVMTLSYELSEETSEALKDLTKNKSMPELAFMMTCMGIYMRQMSYSNAWIMGVSYYGDLQKVLPFHFEMDTKETIRTLLNNVYKTLGLVYKNQFYEALSGEGLKLILTHPEASKVFEFPSGSFDGIVVRCLGAKGFEVIYSSQYYSKQRVNDFGHSLLEMITMSVLSMDQSFESIDWLTQADEQIIHQMNDWTMPIRKESIIDLFKNQVVDHPHRLAIVDDVRSLTFKELDEESTKVAAYLIDVPSPVIGLMFDREVDMVIGIVAVLKAGKGYLPIDPKQPEDRIQYMLEDAKVSLVLSSKKYVDEGFDVKDIKACVSYDSFENHVTDEHLAYIIYTSGSSGRPKGVPTKHRSVVNLVHGMAEVVSIKEGNFAFLFPFIFDGSLQGLALSLCKGFSLHIVSEEVKKSGPELLNYLNKHKIDIMDGAPIHLRLMGPHVTQDFGVKKMMIGGEALKGSDCYPFEQTNAQIINVYGPTECCVECTHYYVQSNEIARVPLGKPMPNYKVFIMDNDKLQKPGFLGEICISGPGLSEGYLNLSELTSEKFQYNEQLQQRIYRTGDLGRLNKGNFEFYGRIDQQVKLRGYRIETGEIENCLIQSQLVEDVLVTLKSYKGEDYLVAYYVSENTCQEQVFIEVLKKHLPDYMIPTFYIPLDVIPQTIGGKCNYKALPDIETTSLMAEYREPTCQVSKSIAAMYMKLLETEELVGMDDDFFKLGGHSLKAAALLSELKSAFEVDIQLMDIFEHSTVEALTEKIKTLDYNQVDKMVKVKEQSHYPLSSAQKRMYLTYRMAPESTAYNMPFAFKVQGYLDTSLLETAVQKMIDRHDIIRTNYAMIDEELVQTVRKPEQLKIERLSNQSVEYLMMNFAMPFDLEQDLLFRMTILDDNDCQYVFFDTHHIVCDGVSVHLLIQEIVTLYCGGHLEPLDLQYKDYACWQSEHIKGVAYEKQGAYWRNQLIGSEQVDLSYYKKQEMAIQGNALFIRSFDSKHHYKIQTLMEKHHVSLFAILMSSIALVLSRYTRKDDITIGTPSANRTSKDTENMIGMFVNTLVIRNRLSLEMTVLDWLEQTQQVIIEALDHQSYQFEDIVSDLSTDRERNNPLFNVMFALQNFDKSEMALNDSVWSSIDIKKEDTKFDLMLFAQEEKGELQFAVEYNPYEFDRLFVEQLVDHVEYVISQYDSSELIESIRLEDHREPEGEINDVPFLEKAFDRAVEESHLPAVICGEQIYSYQSLDAHANHIASKLSGEVVAISMERSYEMMVALVAVMKAGCISVIIDPKLPKERFDKIFSDSGAEILLTKEMIHDYDCVFVELEAGNFKGVTPQDALYIIYTSGSTGEPKGVVQTKETIMNLIEYQKYDSLLEMKTPKVMSQIAAMSFDVFYQEVYGAFLTGSTLVIVDEKTKKDPRELLKFVKRYDIDIMTLPTVYLKHMAGDDELLNLLPDTLSDIIVSGEQLVIHEKLRDRLEALSIRLHNQYGPSETHVVTAHEMTSGMFVAQPSIGRSVRNTRIHILDEGLNEQPKGIVGEICVSGKHLAKEYLNDFDLTHQKFIDHPIYGRIYRTGDLGRWQEDELIYCGRRDNQVKVRGFRVELGEIEEKLLGLGVHSCAVIVKEQILVAYVVGSIDGLSDKLHMLLPDYMVPSHFVSIDKIPLTQNGKVDKKQLPDVRVNSGIFEAPKNSTEEILVAIWQQVLQVNEPISVLANFFDLGGHSLKGTSVVSKLEKAMSVKLELSEIFDYPTIRSLACLIDGKSRNAYEAIKVLESASYYETSSAQKRIYVLSKLDRHGVNYNMPVILKLIGELDVERLTKAFESLIQRHESFRTTFLEKDETVVQYIEDEMSAVSRFKMESLVPENFIQPFDLSKDLMLRVGLSKLSETEHLLGVDMHHIISDGTTLTLIIKEFMALYAGETLQPLTIQYKDFAAWQNKLLSSDVMTTHKNYWLDCFDEVPVLDMPLDFERPSHKQFKGDLLFMALTKEDTQNLNDLAQGKGVSLFMVIQSAFKVLLHKYTGQRSIVLGTPLAGRTHSDLESVVGMFINTLALKTDIDPNMSFHSLLKQVKEETVTAFDHQLYQFEDLVEALDLTRDTSRNPLFDVMIAFQNYEMAHLELGGIEIAPYGTLEMASKFDMLLYVEEHETLEFRLEYDIHLFQSSTMQTLLDRFNYLLTQILKSPEKQIKDYSLIMEEDEALLLTYQGKDNEVPSLLEVLSSYDGEETAVICGERCFSYKALHGHSNHMAKMIGSKSTSEVVAIAMDRSYEMMVGLMATAKAGCISVIIDPSLPKERFDKIYNDSGAEILLTKDAVHGHTGMPVELEMTEYDESVDQDALYIIYTSGSTGEPKGVVQTKETIMNLINYQKYDSLLEMKTPKVMSQIAAMSFDVFYQEVYGAFLTGSTLVIVDEKTKKSPKKLLSFVSNQNIEIMTLPTVYLKHMAGDDELLGLFSDSLSDIIVSGEQLVIHEKLKDRLEALSIRLHNQYGPSETHVVTTCEMTSGMFKTQPSIGQVVRGNQIYILDEWLQCQPVGIVGEICVSGRHLAKGYLNDLKLTEEKFIEHPKYGRLYRTGDLGRWQDDELIYCGRKDTQVKVRGFRVELGEIEEKILGLGVVSCTVVVKDQILVAYVVGEERDLKTPLQELLPDYMVPSSFVFLEAIPLTRNGKVDKKRLPEVVLEDHHYVEASTDTEKALVGIWQSILKISEPIGIHANFFDLGGHSLRATSMVSHIEKELSVVVELSDVFRYPTIRELADLIEKKNHHIYVGIEKVRAAAYYETSSAQKRIYVLSKLDHHGVNYNMPVILKLTGELNIERLKYAFEALIRRHESFRTTFETWDEELVQRVHTVEEVLESFVVDMLDPDDFVKPFDLSKDLMLRVGLKSLSDHVHLLGVDMHHIISDGTTLTLIIKEFMALYAGETLQPLTIQYKDFAAWQNRLLSSDVMTTHKNYWLDCFDEVPVLDMPLDFERPSHKQFKGDLLFMALTKEDTQNLNDLAQSKGVSLFMVIQSAFKVLLHKYTGQRSIVLGTPLAGRTHSDLESVVGMFINTLALKTDIDPNMSFHSLLKQVKEETVTAFDHQLYQFEDLVEALDLTRDTSRNPLFDVMIAFQNYEMAHLELGGIEIAPYGTLEMASKFDMLLYVEEHETLEFRLEYDIHLFQSSTMQTLLDRFNYLLTQILKSPEKQIKDYSLIMEEDEALLLTYQGKDNEVPSLLEVLSSYDGEETAVICGERCFSYKALHGHSNHMAKMIGSKSTSEVVAIAMDRSYEMMVGLMATAKAGCISVIIDPSLPKERFDKIYNDSGAEILLTKDAVHGHTGMPVELEMAEYDESVDQEALYIIYTSGSTGEPKGVVQTKETIMNLINYQKYDSLLEMKTPKVMSQIAAMSFDVFYQEVYGAFLTGSTLVIVDEKTKKSPKKLLSFVSNQNIEIMTLPTIYLKHMAGDDELLGLFSDSLSDIIVSGEQLVIHEKLKDRLEALSIRLHNQYGPSETHVVTTCEMTSGMFKTQPSIGQVVRGNQIYILDEWLQCQPVGIAGEICVSGRHLAKGYLNDLKLTEEKFIEHPKYGRLYRTGDLGRWQDDELIYCGRKDTQVKVRGFRVELGEIEEKILGLGVVSCAVVVKDQILVAYVVGEERDLKTPLQELLPDYMVPSSFVFLEAIPLTRNGKVDKKRLPEVVLEDHHYVEASTDTEKALMGIWQSILKISEPIGIHANFFDLGGHSLRATSMVSHIEKELSVVVELSDVFRYPTIQALALVVDGKQSVSFKHIQSIEKAGYYETSSVQKRLYLVHQMNPESLAYNLPYTLKYTGQLDEKRFLRALTQLMSRHESLRTSLTIKGKMIVQIVEEHIRVPFIYRQSNENEEVIVQQFMRPFDLSKAPLWRIEIVETSENEGLLLLDMHHIIGDGQSIGIFIEELMCLYNGGRLKHQRIQYKDYAYWQNQFLTSEKAELQMNYWMNQLSGSIPSINLPYDYDRQNKTLAGALIYKSLDHHHKTFLKDLSKEYGVSLFMVLLAMFKWTLKDITRQDDLIVGTPSAGRLHADFDNIMGMFVNTVVIRSNLSHVDSFESLIEEVSVNAIDAFKYQSIQYDQLVEALKVKRVVGRNPLFDVMFRMNNEMDDYETIDFDGFDLSPISYDRHVEKFDLTVSVMETEEGIDVMMSYSTDLFSEQTIEEMMMAYMNTIETLMKDIKTPLIVSSNKSCSGKPLQSMMNQAFEQYKKRTLAVYGSDNYSYEDIDFRSNDLLNTLIQKGMKPGAYIGVCVNNPLDALIVLIASIKGRYVFVPIHEKYADEIVKTLYHDLNVDLTVVSDNYKQKFAFTSTISVNETEGFYESVDLDYDFEDPLYISFTSGTTGRPKGILGWNGAVADFIAWEQDYLDMSNIHVAQLTNYTNDAYLRDVLLPLISGGKIIMPDKHITKMTSDEAKKWLHRVDVTVMHCTPSLFEMFVQQGLNPEDYPTLEHVLMAGEVMKPSMISTVWSTLNHAVKVTNLYGASETTMVKLYHPVTEADLESGKIPVGKGISDAEVWIVDETGLVATGDVGEIVIASSYIAKGYATGESMENFNGSSYVTDTHYMTNDLGYIDDDGVLHYVGRKDRQVKIRGNRVELSAIDHVAMTDEGVEKCHTCAVFESGQPRVISYVVTNDLYSQHLLMTTLKSNLLDYMLPNQVVVVDGFELNVNGKIDESKLPNPVGAVVVDEKDDLEAIIEKVLLSFIEDRHTIGLHEDFFELGGNSLMAMLYVTALNEELSMSLNIRDVLTYVTIHSLADYISSQRGTELTPIEKIELEDAYPLSSAQERIFVTNELFGETTAYNMAIAIKVHSAFEYEKMLRTLTALVQRHEVLRANVQIVDNQVKQIFKAVDVIDLDMNYVYSEEDVLDVLKAFVRPFDVYSEPLYRFGVLQYPADKNKFILMMDIHHMISDGYSQSVLIQDFMTIYNGEHLEELTIQYKDYAVWKRKMTLDIDQDYWTKRLKDVTTLTLNYDYQRPHIMTYEGRSIQFTLNRQLRGRIDRYCQLNGLTMFSFVHGILKLLLHKHSGQEDLVIGTPVYGREHPDLLNQVGVYINMLPVRSTVDSNKTLKDNLLHIKEELLSDMAHQLMDFESIVESADIKQDTSRGPLVDVVYIHQEKVGQNHSDDMLTESIYLEKRTSKYDITFMTSEFNGEMVLEVNYATSLFKEATICSYFDHISCLIEQTLNNDQLILADLSLLSYDDEMMLSSNSMRMIEGAATIHETFENWVTRMPDLMAVLTRKDEMTYRLLSERSNQLAHYLLSLNMKDESTVGILMDRTSDMLVAMLGILKAGLCYVPIDKKMPMARVEAIVEEAEMAYMIVDDLSLELDHCTTFSLTQHEIINQEKSSCNKVVRSNQLAYMIFTSGSTGKPKGVMIEHRHVFSFVKGTEHMVVPDHIKRILSMTSIAFDIFVLESLLPLMTGKTIVLADRSALEDQEILNDLVQQHVPDLIQTTPSRMIGLLTSSQSKALFKTCQHVLIGGEVLRRDVVEKLLAYKHLKIFNMYGPTEATVWASFKQVKSVDAIDIGTALPNYHLYILNEKGRIQPEGIIGEIGIVGPCVGRGYFKDEEKTKRAFVDDPYNSEFRMYKTGDLGYRTSDGCIQFVSRNDNQVKVRGYRIELSDIEANLLAHSGIDQAVAVIKNLNETSKICAYIVGECSSHEAMMHLKERLPVYMLPDHIVELEIIPLLVSGKVNRKQLPEPEFIEVAYDDAFLSDEALALEKIFKEVLNFEGSIGADVSFFDLGGNSLTVTLLINNIEAVYKKRLKMGEVFEHPTIRGLAEQLNLNKKESMPFEKAMLQEHYPLSDSQQRMYMVSQLNPDSLAYNIPRIHELEGKLNIDALRSAFNTLVSRHNQLRSYYFVEAGQPRQGIFKEGHYTFEIEHECVEKEILQSKMKSFVRPFDLKNDLPIRVKLLSIDDNTHYLMLDVHHIATDGYSLNLLMKEFEILYSGGVLKELTYDYMDYVTWQVNRKNTESYQLSERFWQSQVGGQSVDITDIQDQKLIESRVGDTFVLELGLKRTQALKEFCKTHRLTPYMAFLSGLTIVFSKLSGQKEMMFGSPIAGRERPEVNEIVGVFINTLMLKLSYDEDLSTAAYISRIRESILNAFEHQAVPIETIMSYAGTNQLQDLFDVSFGVMNEWDGKGAEEMDVALKGFESTERVEKFGLSISASELRQNFVLTMNYMTGKYSRTLIEFIGNGLIRVLDQLFKVDQVSDIRLSDDGPEMLVEDIDVKGPHTVQEQLLSSLKEYEDKIAVVHGNETRTYMQLFEEVKTIAANIAVEHQSGSYIGVCLDDPFEAMTVILGVILSGCVVVPIDVNLPEGIVESILNDVPVAQMITDETYDILRKPETISVQFTYDEEAPMYVSFTSGTTGKPKAILGWNRALKEFIDWEIKYLKADRGLRVGQLTNYANDAYYRDLLLPLFVGGTLVIPEKKMSKMPLNELQHYISKHKIEVLHCTPSVYGLLFEGEATYDYSALQHVLLAGEKIPKSLILKTLDRFGERVSLTNLYGSTETTMIRTHHKIAAEDVHKRYLPVGRPIDDTLVKVIRNRVQVGPYEIGEIYIHSPYMTRGYLNAPNEQKKRFVEQDGLLCYKTGDYGYFNVSGVLTYIGRMDNQIKIRGNRVELSNIQYVMENHSNVSKAYVTLDKKTKDFIVAYYTGDVTEIVLKNHMKHHLGDYMMPKFLCRVERFILNANNKVDESSLPEVSVVMNENYVAPESKEEKLLEKCFAQVLEIKESIGVYDDFFDLGGDSLIMLKLADSIKRQFDLEQLDIIDIYENPTIRGIAEKLAESDAERKIFYQLTRSEQANKTIYAVPYMGGDASCYGALGRSFDELNTGIRLMSTSIFEIGSVENDEHMTMEKFARIRAEEIIAQESGEIYLLGHCGGCIIAIAIADELRKMGKKVQTMYFSGFVPRREPNSIQVNAMKRRDFNAFVNMLREIGFADRLNVTVAKKYRNIITETMEYRLRRKKQIWRRALPLRSEVVSIFANRDQETFDSKRGYKKWKRYVKRVTSHTIESKSHYFITRDSKVVSQIITDSMAKNKGSSVDVVELNEKSSEIV